MKFADNKHKRGGLEMSERLKRATNYTRFKGEKVRVLVIDSGYFIVKEFTQGIEKLGHMVRLRRLKEVGTSRGRTSDKKTGDENFLRGLLFDLCEFKPDFIFTVNHLGFDQDGKLTQILTELKVPFAVWYVDSPRYILEGYGRTNASGYAYIFVWDPAYIRWLQSIGFKNVSYLPLGTDTEIFKPIDRVPAKYIADLSFVGNSMVEPVERWKRKVQEVSSSHSCSDRKLAVVESYTALKATLEYRKELLQSLIPYGLRIYGDKGWHILLNGIKLHKEVDYYNKLPLVYNGSKININLTSFQMPLGCNQRVFDVSAAGGFLITDERDTLADLFVPDKEVVTFANNAELVEKVKFYLAHPATRENIAKNARTRAIRDHTYEHRVDEMIKKLKERFAN